MFSKKIINFNSFRTFQHCGTCETLKRCNYYTDDYDYRANTNDTSFFSSFKNNQSSSDNFFGGSVSSSGSDN